MLWSCTQRAGAIEALFTVGMELRRVTVWSNAGSHRFPPLRSRRACEIKTSHRQRRKLKCARDRGRAGATQITSRKWMFTKGTVSARDNGRGWSGLLMLEVLVWKHSGWRYWGRGSYVTTIWHHYSFSHRLYKCLESISKIASCTRVQIWTPSPFSRAC